MSAHSSFERWRERGDGWSPLLSEAPLALALAHVDPVLGPGRRVLDLGAGPGHMAALFRESGALALALDVDPVVSRRGRDRHPGPDRVVGDQSRLPLAGACVDAIFSFSTFQYSDRAAVLGECARILRPGGRIAVVENLAGNPFSRLGRWLRSVTGTPYPPHQVPRHHLRWSERRIHERHFRDVRFDLFHLLTPMLLASRATDSAPVERGSRTLTSGLYRWLRGCDRLLLPRLASAAWCLVVRGVR